MHSYERKSKAWMGFTAALVACFVVASCGSGEGKLFGGGVVGTSGVPGGPPGSITPGTACPANAGPTVPTVTSSEPPNGSQSTSTSTNGVANSGKRITANFSLPMNGATINSTTFTVTPLGGAALTPASVTYDIPTRVATFTTSAALSPNTSYTAVITTGAQSAAGVPLGCTYAWNFRTAVVAGASPTINLGLAVPFALASAGGITNTGPTKINGDVVLDPNQTCNAVPVGSGNNFGACGGNPLNVPTNNAGDRVMTQVFPDTTTADAVIASLNSTWMSLAPAALPGGIVLGCGTIGTGGGGGAGVGCAGNATLAPAVYISATASTIDVTGDLTLNAQGNADAVWVFQAPSALNVSGGARILLINGAKASNVWWYVGSSATLTTLAAYNGNILASATVALGTGVTSCGRLLAGATGAGSLTMLSNTVSVPAHPNAPAGCQ